MRSESFEVSGPVRASIKVEHGHVFVQHGAGVEQARVTLSPMVAGDEVAAELIGRATVELGAGGLVVSVPPGPAGGGATTVVRSGGGLTVTQTLHNVSIGSNVVGVSIVNGRVVSAGDVHVGGAVPADGAVHGGVRVNVLLPADSSVTVRTVSAGLEVGSFGEWALDTVDFDTMSGALHVREAQTVIARTICGDVVVDAAITARVTSTSGDVALEVGGRAEVSTVFGDVAVFTVRNGVAVSVATVSGDIRVSTGSPEFGVALSTSTVTGRVRGPRPVAGR
ncbi:DUF4097 family beta strand repeat-containing protein [Lentzea sp. DG1S-22]|uniref:DUF4097 family beta strand repeat-containing protein n=1 Tax=Lentzea sp. DG1S-22 TaxID=3108822 RepID=UPI002E79EE20|nr:DUF4097 family beta strand repeat-containing protein [Lentzea sp. DG1S-22]WVH84380.1 DUF4097 family beta strand repeat-containing protein [Lentzea sp. DG1S-22]